MNLPGQAEVSKKVSDLLAEMVLTHNSMVVLAAFAVQAAQLAANVRTVSPAHAKFVDEVFEAAVDMSKEVVEPPRVIYTDGNQTLGTKQ